MFNLFRQNFLDFKVRRPTNRIASPNWRSRSAILLNKLCVKYREHILEKIKELKNPGSSIKLYTRYTKNAPNEYERNHQNADVIKVF